MTHYVPSKVSHHRESKWSCRPDVQTTYLHRPFRLDLTVLFPLWNRKNKNEEANPKKICCYRLLVSCTCVTTSRSWSNYSLFLPKWTGKSLGWTASLSHKVSSVGRLTSRTFQSTDLVARVMTFYIEIIQPLTYSPVRCQQPKALTCKPNPIVSARWSAYLPHTVA